MCEIRAVFYASYILYWHRVYVFIKLYYIAFALHNYIYIYEYCINGIEKYYFRNADTKCVTAIVHRYRTAIFLCNTFFIAHIIRHLGRVMFRATPRGFENVDKYNDFINHTYSASVGRECMNA